MGNDGVGVGVAAGEVAAGVEGVGVRTGVAVGVASAGGSAVGVGGKGGSNPGLPAAWFGGGVPVGSGGGGEAAGRVVAGVGEGTVRGAGAGAGAAATGYLHCSAVAGATMPARHTRTRHQAKLYSWAKKQMYG